MDDTALSNLFDKQCTILINREQITSIDSTVLKIRNLMLCKCLSDGWWSWRFEFMAIIPIYNAATKRRKECKTWCNAIDWRFCKQHWMVIVDSASGELFSTAAQTVSESTSLDKSVGEPPKLFVLRFEWDATFGCTAHWIANALTTCRPNPFSAVPHSSFQLPWSSNFPHIWSVGRSYRNFIPTPFVCIMSCFWCATSQSNQLKSRL